MHELGLTHLCFNVDRIDAEYQRLLTAGAPFPTEPQDFGSFRATNGNRHADLLFNTVNRRYELKPTVVTANRPFGEWARYSPTPPAWYP